MPVFSRIKSPYDLTKRFRVNNGTTLDFRDSLSFWMRAFERTPPGTPKYDFFDASDSGNVTGMVSGDPQIVKGPKTRFPIQGLNLGNGLATNIGGYDNDKDTALIFSGWIYLNTDPGLNNDGFPILYGNGSSTQWQLYVDSVGRLAVRLSNSGNTKSIEWRTVKYGVIDDQRWVHFTVSLDTNLANYSEFEDGTHLRIFINGQKQAIQVGTSRNSPDDGSLSVTHSSTSIQFGYAHAEDQDGLIFLDGALADVAMFQPSTDITDAQATALYTAAVDGCYPLQSGFLSVSPKNIIHDADHRKTSAANVALVSNDGRLGNHSIFFDDSRAINFTNPGATNYPSMLTKDNPLFDTVYYGHVDGELSSTTAAAASYGIFDQYYSENNQIPIKPFVESEIYIDHSGSFYLTGTDKTTIPYFDQNLGRKAIISFVGDINAEETIGSTSDVEAGSAEPTAPWMKYYSFKTNQFHSVGTVTPGSPSMTAQNLDLFVHNTGLGFSPLGFQVLGEADKRVQGNYTADGAFGNVSAVYVSSASLERKFPISGSNNYLSELGRPIDNFGFPGTDQFEAPEDFRISLSDKISSPFLVEKISVRFKFKTKFEYSDRMRFLQDRTVANGSRRISSTDPYLWNRDDAASDTDFTGHRYSMAVKMITAFLLRQDSTPRTRPHYFFDTDFTPDGDRVGDPDSFHKLSVSGSHRDIIGYGQLSIFQESRDSNFLESGNKYMQALDSTGSLIDVNIQALRESGLARDQNIIVPPVTNGADQDTPEFTDIAEINFVPKNVFQSTARGVIQARADSVAIGSGINSFPAVWRNNRSYLFDDQELVEERRYANGINSHIPGDISIDIPGGNAFQSSLKVSATPPNNTEEYDSPSPYVLFPHDELVLGLQAPIANSWWSSDNIYANYMKLPPGQIQLTLYGSFVKIDRPTSFSHAQNLNTIAVSEAIGPATTKDRFELTQRFGYSRSFSDEVISGSYDSSTGKTNSDPSTIYEGFMLQSHGNPTPGKSTTLLARRVGGYASTGTAGEKGSLQIYNVLSDTTERDYDSMLPSFLEMGYVDIQHFGLSDAYIGGLASGTRTIKLGTVSGTPGTFNPNWFYSFPFEGRYNGVRRTDQIVDEQGNSIEDGLKIMLKDDSVNVNHLSLTNAGSLAQSVFLTPRNFQNFPKTAFVSNDGQSTGTQAVQNYSASRKVLFSIGGLSRGRYFTRAIQNGDSAVAFIEGFKYGISNTEPNFPKAVYSRNSYGQFRDLMEMRKLTAYNKNSTTVYPVHQSFVSRNEQPLSIDQRNQTSCSNLSTYATSSIPFFDRDDNSALNRDPIVTSTRNISPNFVAAAGPFVRSTGF